ncbi:MAG: TonB-dependent receptor [bacterium]|nr:TonB-dependent receptor [bacterium]
MKRKILLLFVMLPAFLLPFPARKQGIIKGKIIDGLSKQPLPGVLVDPGADKKFKTLSNIRGEFIIRDVPVGNYNINFLLEGFNPIIKTDVIVKSNRITFLTVDYSPTLIVKEQVDVRPAYFKPASEAPVSMKSFTAEEIRRSPGSAGDISRIVSSLASVAQVSDDDNGLAVRGGSPVENGFFIDNIEVPNINHFPVWGSTGGPIGLLNGEFIKEVDFYAGGFSSLYGEKLSSVMDIRLREGNRQEMDNQLDLTMAGIGLTSEGPLFGGKGSWLISYRKSYLDLLVDAIGTGVSPKFSDLQGKIVVDLNARNILTIMGLGGWDLYKMDKEKALEEGEDSYGSFKSIEYTVGMNWLFLWSNKGYSETSLSYTRTNFESAWNDNDEDSLDSSNNSNDGAVQLRNVNTYNFNAANRLKIGFEYKRLISRQRYFESADIDELGNPLLPVTRDIKRSFDKLGIFFFHHWTYLHKFHVKLGFRGDFFSYNKRMEWSPRLSLTYQLSPNSSIYASTGIYHQSLPLQTLLTSPGNKDLKTPTAYHYSLGLTHLLSRDVQLTADVYLKEYRRLPLSYDYPTHSLSDNPGHTVENLVDTGRGRSYGVEVTLQKKLKKKLYGLISGCYYRSRYRDLPGQWRNRVYDNRFIVTLLAGYKPDNKWEFSVKWSYAGGRPYTPFDMEQSTALNEGIVAIDKVNMARLDAYHSLNLRVDKRFHFKSTNLILFFSLWNVYNRKNTAYIHWDYLKNAPGRTNQWGFLPVFGVEYEF